jgi:hypothetical protein
MLRRSGLQHARRRRKLCTGRSGKLLLLHRFSLELLAVGAPSELVAAAHRAALTDGDPSGSPAISADGRYLLCGRTSARAIDL